MLVEGCSLKNWTTDDSVPDDLRATLEVLKSWEVVAFANGRYIDKDTGKPFNRNHLILLMLREYVFKNLGEYRGKRLRVRMDKFLVWITESVAEKCRSVPAEPQKISEIKVGDRAL